MKKFACLIVALLAVALTVSEIDAGCGGGSGAGLFGRGGGLFARLRARRQQSSGASYGVSYGSSAGWSSTSSFRSSSMCSPQPAVIMQSPAFLPMPKAVVPNGCNCPGNVPAPVPDAPMAKPPEKVSAGPFTPTYKTVMTTRAAIGHSHSHVAADGAIHTWHHNSNPTHSCIIPVIRNGKIEPCGVYVNVQDRGPMPVTIAKSVRVDLQQHPQDVVARPYQSPTTVFALPRASGCVNGSCAIPRSRLSF